MISWSKSWFNTQLWSVICPGNFQWIFHIICLVRKHLMASWCFGSHGVHTVVERIWNIPKVWPESKRRPSNRRSAVSRWVWRVLEGVVRSRGRVQEQPESQQPRFPWNRICGKGDSWRTIIINAQIYYFNELHQVLSCFNHIEMPFWWFLQLEEEANKIWIKNISFY